MAVGKASSADDNQQQYRLRENPAKRHIMGGAVDAGGTSRGSSCKTSAVVISAVQPHRLEVLKAASNAFVAEEQALGGVVPNGMPQGFKIAWYTHRVQATSPLVADRRPNLLLPLPRLVSIRRPKGGGCGGMDPVSPRRSRLHA